MNTDTGNAINSRSAAAHRATVPPVSGDRQRAAELSHCCCCGCRVTARSIGATIKTKCGALAWCLRCTAGQHWLAFGLEVAT
jgi:hypothetical protein